MALSVSLLPASLVSPTPSTGSEGSRTSEGSVTTPVKDAQDSTTLGEEPTPTEAILDVECGPNKGVLYLSKLCQGSKGSCILFNGSWLTPNEFQYVSGRETAKDWKRSIRHYGKSMKLLLTKSIMTVQPPVCKCEGCRPDLVTAENKEEIRTPSPLLIQSPSFLIKPKSPTTPQDNRKNGLVAHAAAVKKAKVVAKTTANQKPLKRMAETNSDKTPAALLHDNNNTDSLKDSELGEIPQQLSEESSVDGASSPPRESRLNNIIEGLKNAAKPKEGDTVQGTLLTNGHLDNSQNGVNDTSDNEGKSVDVMTPAASSAALSPSASSTASPLAATVSAPASATVSASIASSAPLTHNGTSESSAAIAEGTAVPLTTTGSIVAPLGDTSGLAPGILRNMLKIPMDGSKPSEGGSSDGSASNPPHSPSSNPASVVSNSQTNHSPAMNLTTSISQPGGITLPSTERNTSPRLSSKSPVDHVLHHRAPETKLWSPHEANHYSSTEKTSATPEKKNSEINGHYVIDHKPYMSSAMTPPALKPISQKDQERSPKRHDSNSKTDADRKKDMPVFRMPEAEAVQPKVYAPVTWPPVAPDAPPRKEESSPRRPLSSNSEKRSKTPDVPSKATSASSSSHKSPSSSSSSSSEGKSGHHGSSSSNKMSSSATVTSSSATALSQEAMTAQYHDYLRQPGLYPNLAHPRMDSAEYLAFLRKYYEWYELQQRLYAAYPLSAATAGSVNPYASFMPGMMDPRLRPEVPKQPAHVATPHMSPFIYGIDPRALPSAVPVDWSKCGLNRQDIKSQTPGPSSTESPSKPSTSAAHTSPHPAAKQEVNGKRTHAETEAEALDLSVKRRRMEESRAAAEKETMHRDMMSAFGRVAPPLSNGLHAAAAASTQGMPMAYPMYPGMWDLAALQQGAMTGVSMPGLTTGNPYAPPLSKDHVDPAVTHMPFTLPHLTPPCTSLAERERLMSHFRL